MARRPGVWWGLVLAALVALAGAAAWWWPGGVADGSLQRVRASGVLRVGYAPEPPYAVLGPDGSVTGACPAVARVVAQALGVQPQWVRLDFAQLIPALEQGRIDLVASGLFVTAERARRVRFTHPTLQVRAGWLTAPGNPRGLGDYAAIGAAPAPGGAPLKLAVLDGSVEQAALAARALPAGTLVVMPDAQSAMVAVARGRVDGLALSWPAVQQLAAAEPHHLQAVAVAGDAGHHTALALRPQDLELHRAVNQALQGHVGSTAHLALLARHGLGPADLPRPASAAPQ